MILEIKQGILKGAADKSLSTNRTFYKFTGIPYGEPPIGELRFRPPVPAGKWTGIRDATGEPQWCIQRLFTGDSTIGSEDCLYINVFTPEFPNSKAPLKPVMVHIFGGGYMYGSGSLKVSSFDHLVDYDVIMVTFSQRLHILGYLNLNTESCAGNCGAKDQVLALKWIQENIHSFGGDPDNVTLFGESSGASSTHLLSLSPLSRGLFKRVIVQSATGLAPWAFRENQVDVGFKIGQRLGFEGSDPEELANFLRKQPAEILRDEALHALKTHREENSFDSRSLLFTPSVEKFAENAFLFEHPKLLAKTADPVPTIMGVAEVEGVTILFDSPDPDLLMRLKNDLTKVVKFNVPCQDSQISDVTHKLEEFYLEPLGEERSDEKIRSRLLDLYSDLFNVNLYDAFENVIKSKEPLYIYQFAFAGNLNESINWPMKIPGCLHADESNYISLSRGFFPNPKIDDRDRRVIKNLCTLWTNFARTGNPNPPPINAGDEWKPHTISNPCYLKINEKLDMQEGIIYGEGRIFWKKLFETYVQ